MLFRHPIMFHPPPEALGKATCDNLPHNKSKSGCTNRMLVVSRQISSSSSNGRWDRMVLKKKSLTGNKFGLSCIRLIKPLASRKLYW